MNESELQQILDDLYAQDIGAVPRKRPRKWQSLVEEWSQASERSKRADPAIGFDDFQELLYVRDRLQQLLDGLPSDTGGVVPSLVRAVGLADAAFEGCTRSSAIPLADGRGWWWQRVPLLVSDTFERLIQARGY